MFFPFLINQKIYRLEPKSHHLFLLFPVSLLLPDPYVELRFTCQYFHHCLTGMNHVVFQPIS